MESSNIKLLLDNWVSKYYNSDFIQNDPVQIPHRFTQKQDIEIAGLFAALFAWGNRKTIINKCNDLLMRMDNSPYQFVLHSSNQDKKSFYGFVHRTFNTTDINFIIQFLHLHYSKNISLENAFFNKNTVTVEMALHNFYCNFIQHKPIGYKLQYISSPLKNAACKRLCMYLRWMVRKCNQGIDFGVWTNIPPSALMIPLDMHVANVARDIGLLQRRQNDWKSVVMLTDNLRILNPNDPVIYDYALFSKGVNKLIL